MYLFIYFIKKDTEKNRKQIAKYIWHAICFFYIVVLVSFDWHKLYTMDFRGSDWSVFNVLAYTLFVFMMVDFFPAHCTDVPKQVSYKPFANFCFLTSACSWNTAQLWVKEKMTTQPNTNNNIHNRINKYAYRICIWIPQSTLCMPILCLFCWSKITVPFICLITIGCDPN